MGCLAIALAAFLGGQEFTTHTHAPRVLTTPTCMRCICGCFAPHSARSWLVLQTRQTVERAFVKLTYQDVTDIGVRTVALWCLSFAHFLFRPRLIVMILDSVLVIREHYGNPWVETTPTRYDCTCKHKDSIFALCRHARCVIMAQIATRQGRGAPRSSQSGVGRDDRSSPWENTFRNRLKEFQRKEEEEEEEIRPRTVRLHGRVCV